MPDSAHYPLTLAVEPGERLALRLHYRPDLFTAARAAELADRLVLLLEQVAEDPDRPLSTLTVLSPEQHEQVVRKWNDTAVELPEVTLAELWSEQVRRTPEAMALVASDERLSYAELDERVDRLAAQLAHRGAGPDRIVAVALPVRWNWWSRSSLSSERARPTFRWIWTIPPGGSPRWSRTPGRSSY
ncbi:AMP-binding protein [Streptomyces sp. M10(2022)]